MIWFKCEVNGKTEREREDRKQILVLFKYNVQSSDESLNYQVG